MKIIEGREFDRYWREVSSVSEDAGLNAAVRDIIEEIRRNGDKALRLFSERFDRAALNCFEISPDVAKDAWQKLVHEDGELAEALRFAHSTIRRFAEEQKKQLSDFEIETAPGLVTGQRIIPVGKVALYAPGGRYPLISSVLMGAVPAIAAGVGELVLASPPRENGLPDSRILATAHLAGIHRVFAIGGAQAIAALALGTESVPRVDLIVGPGNKFVAAAKRLLFGEVGIDFVAGPTDVLIIADEPVAAAASGDTRSPENRFGELIELMAADMIAQAEHDPDARARALLPRREHALALEAAVERRLAALPSPDTARASLLNGGLIIVCNDQGEAVDIANRIAPEHLELMVEKYEAWVPLLKNYGSLFIGKNAAEVLGDYSAGINHTLPTSGNARFTGGLSVRHFLKTVTTLRCKEGEGRDKAVLAAERIARAEGLDGHAESAAMRKF